MIHDSKTCTNNNGQPCEMCTWANSTVEQRERAEWSLETEMSDFASRYGEEALVEKVDLFMTERGLY